MVVVTRACLLLYIRIPSIALFCVTISCAASEKGRSTQLSKPCKRRRKGKQRDSGPGRRKEEGERRKRMVGEREKKGSAQERASATSAKGRYRESSHLPCCCCRHPVPLPLPVVSLLSPSLPFRLPPLACDRCRDNLGTPSVLLYHPGFALVLLTLLYLNNAACISARLVDQGKGQERKGRPAVLKDAG